MGGGGGGGECDFFLLIKRPGMSKIMYDVVGEVVEGYKQIMAIKRNILCPPAVYL